MRATGMGRVAVAVARRPSLWLTAARQARRLAPDHWWRRHPLEPDDVVRYLIWCRQWAAIAR